MLLHLLQFGVAKYTVGPQEPHVLAQDAPHRGKVELGTQPRTLLALEHQRRMARDAPCVKLFCERPEHSSPWWWS